MRSQPPSLLPLPPFLAGGAAPLLSLGVGARKGQSPGMKRAGAEGVAQPPRVVETPWMKKLGSGVGGAGKAERRGIGATGRQESCVGPELWGRTSAICQANQKIQKMAQHAGESPGWGRGGQLEKHGSTGLLRGALCPALAGLALGRWWLPELPWRSPSPVPGRVFTGRHCGASHGFPGAPGPPWLSCCPSRALPTMPHPQLPSVNS